MQEATGAIARGRNAWYWAKERVVAQCFELG